MRLSRGGRIGKNLNALTMNHTVSEFRTPEETIRVRFHLAIAFAM